jgi:hypothetical protein
VHSQLYGEVMMRFCGDDDCRYESRMVTVSPVLIEGPLPGQGLSVWWAQEWLGYRRHWCQGRRGDASPSVFLVIHHRRVMVPMMLMGTRVTMAL